MSKNKDKRNPGELKTLDMFLREEGLLDEVTETAVKRCQVIVDSGLRNMLAEVEAAKKSEDPLGWDFDKLNTAYEKIDDFLFYYDSAKMGSDKTPEIDLLRTIHHARSTPPNKTWSLNSLKTINYEITVILGTS